MKKLTIIGGGPAALMLAAELDPLKYQVTVYDKKKTVGRKFLVAGEGGLNLTYSSSAEALIAQYVPSEFMSPFIRQFTNQDWIDWLSNLGVSTFIGSSNRVFPEKGMKPIEVLNAIVEQVSSKGVRWELGKQWLGWNETGQLRIEDSEDLSSDIVVFALGGASWKVTGSDGTWSKAFEARGLKVHPFRAANCAFSVAWDKEFIATHAGKPLKNIALTYAGQTAKGELVISKYGLEGNAIYSLSQKIQETLLSHECTVVYLDLKPTMTADQIQAKLKNAKGSKVTDILKKDLNLERSAIGLIKQFTDKESFFDLDKLAEAIKAIPVVIHTAADIDEAISTLGGIALSELDAHCQLKQIPNSYALGEMLDWYAPTGGYLLQGSFSMSFSLAQHLNGLAD